MSLGKTNRIPDGLPGLCAISDIWHSLEMTETYAVQAAFIVHFLSLLSFTNAAYTFHRQRHYRLFETSVDTVPSTPSAQRVRVDSSPHSSSPLRFLSTMLGDGSAESRSHPDATRDVWELAVWDPAPLSLRMFCLFSPGHVLVYWLFLPTAVQDPRPSTTVVTTIVLVGLLSAQLMILQKSFSQQSKDISVIHKEVLNEYDTKYVHPRTQPHMRDVGTQYSSSGTSMHGLHRYEADENRVDTYNPAIILQRSFQTHPNLNYIKHVDPEGYSQRATSPPKNTSTGMAPPLQTPAHLRDASSPIRPRTAIRQPQFKLPAGDGGSLGVYSHANSPLRKAASTNVADARRQRERSLSPVKREGSPLKRSSVPGGANGIRRAPLQGTPARRESGRF